MVIPVCWLWYGAIESGIQSVKTIIGTAENHHDKIFINNGPEFPEVKEWLDRYIKEHPSEYFEYPENQGVIAGLNKGYEIANEKFGDYDFIYYPHTDFYIYEKGWDNIAEKCILEAEAQTGKKVGTVGFGGATGVHLNGYRTGFKSSILYWYVHGERLKNPWEKTLVLDGMSLIVRKELLDKIGGFDKRYLIHHFYDLDICLESVTHDYVNILINIDAHHYGGKTSVNAYYHEWANKKTGQEVGGDNYIHSQNMAKFADKWKSLLPYSI